MSELISEKGNLTSEQIVDVSREFGTPTYLYDESIILKNCDEVLSMPNAFGLNVRYAMKANSNKAFLQLITNKGLDIDASSMNEVRRARNAGILFDKMLLTTQEIPMGEDRKDLEFGMLKGLKYNVCSLRQLELISDHAKKYNIPLSMRIHPGDGGSGESSTRNTANKYSCFGVHLEDLEQALFFAYDKGLTFERVHVHIGSGGDPEKWKENVDRELNFVEDYFPDARFINFGGGFRVRRMPDETPADIQVLGVYAKEKIEKFYPRVGRKLIMEIEPGTKIIANSGYLITEVIDKKRTGDGGFKFLILDGGMEVNTRPLFYGSEHPFYVVSKDGELLSSEFNLTNEDKKVVVGRCCESGDSQSLDEAGHIVPRQMADSAIGDYVVVGGVGAYCSSMSPFNYNSHTQAPEVLLKNNGEIKLIRKSQTLEQVTLNEYAL